MGESDSSGLPRAGVEFERLRDDLREYGYCLIAGALGGDLLGEVRARLEGQASAEGERAIDYANPGHLDNQWVNMLINKGQVFQALVMHPLASRLMAHHLGEHYLLSCCDAQIKHPGSEAMPLHTDQWWMPPPVVPGAEHVRPGDMTRSGGVGLDPVAVEPFIAPPAEANVMWMLSDFSEENGATCVVPGSHRSGLQPDPSVPHKVATIAATGPAGTAVVFDGRLWHAAGANRTQQTRYGITCAFCGPQFRPLENYTRGLRPEVIERCSLEMLIRLGFKAWSTYGHTGDPELDCALPGDEALGEMG